MGGLDQENLEVLIAYRLRAVAAWILSAQFPLFAENRVV
jgi:hypothetical protein